MNYVKMLAISALMVVPFAQANVVTDNAKKLWNYTTEKLQVVNPYDSKTSQVKWVTAAAETGTLAALFAGLYAWCPPVHKAVDNSLDAGKTELKDVRTNTKKQIRYGAGLGTLVVACLVYKYAGCVTGLFSKSGSNLGGGANPGLGTGMA